MKTKYQNRLEKLITFLNQTSPSVLRKKFKKSESQRIYFFFLCGGNIDKYPNRILLKNYLDKQNGCYPIIVEKLFSKFKETNLLFLEDLLSYISDVIVIFPESFGSVCELGAFANVEKLKRKIFVFQDKKFKDSPSFINQGPIQLIKEANFDSIKYINNSMASKNQIGFCDSDAKALLDCKIIQNEKNKEESIWYEEKDNELIIKDLSYYFLALIDLISFFSSLPRNSIAEIFLMVMNVRKCIIPGLDEKEGEDRLNFHRLTDFFVETGIQCNLFLEEGKFIKLKEPIKQIDGSLYPSGNVLFLDSFTNSRKFNSIRTDFLIQSR